MVETISRQAAIDAIKKHYRAHDNDLLELIAFDIEQLPPIQPEIVRCKDCKHWREGTVFSYCDKLYGIGVLDALDYMVAEDDYCSMAERRMKDEDTL